MSESLKITCDGSDVHKVVGTSLFEEMLTEMLYLLGYGMTAIHRNTGDNVINFEGRIAGNKFVHVAAICFIDEARVVIDVTASDDMPRGKLLELAHSLLSPEKMKTATVAAV